MANLLDGGIAKMVASALVGAGMTKPAVLTKITPGDRMPGQISAGTNPIETMYTAKGLEASLTALAQSGTLIAGVDAAIRLFGATIAGGAVPAAGDRVTMAGVTYTIVDQGVSRDSAGASYLCQCRR